MKFIFLKNENWIHAALVEPWVLKWPFILEQILKQTGDPKEIFNTYGWYELYKFVTNGIISCAILEKTFEGCYGSYELTRWASTRRGMGKVLLLRILNQGISIIADRNDISPQAMGSIKQIRDKYSSMFDLDPLDNEVNPLTDDKDDDCQTYNKDGGYEYLEKDFGTDTGGYYISKLDPKATGSYSDSELLDFAVEQTNISKKLNPDISYDVIKQKVENNFAEKYYDVSDIIVGVGHNFEDAIDYVFNDMYGKTDAGRVRIAKESNMKITKQQLKRIIRESIKNKLLVENAGVISMLSKLKKAYPNFHINIKALSANAGELQVYSGTEKLCYMSIQNASKRSASSQKGLPCLGAFEVTWVENLTDVGIGPLVYDIIIELLSLSGSGLKPDSSAVSHPVYGADPDLKEKYGDHGFANNIWLYILKNRPDIKKTKIDPYPFSFTKQKTDDCWAASTIDNWYADRHPEYTKFFKRAMKKRKGKFYPSRSQTHKWLEKWEEGGPSAYQSGYDDVDTYDWWDSIKKVNKRSINKLMPQNHRLEFEADWRADTIPLTYMLTKDNTPILQAMADMGIIIKSNWAFFKKAISTYRRM